MKQMKTLTVNGITYAVTDPAAPRIDDAVLGDAPWSAKKIVDTLCPAFTKTGAVVTCTPVEGYPLEVASESPVTRCGKNLLNNTATSKTVSGITFTVYEDKTLTAKGTATAAIYFSCGKAALAAGGEYRISGCPAGGNGATYYLYPASASGTMDTGSGKKFTASDTGAATVYFYVAKGITLDGAVLKPMVRQADTDSAYEPFRRAETFASGENVPALAGINTLWADSGEITVTGRADPRGGGADGV